MIVYSNLYATNIVKAGVHWANIKLGPEWVWRIDPTTLDIGSGHNCFFGQMYAAEAGPGTAYDSGWRYAVNNGIIAWERAYSLGFAVQYDRDHDDEYVTNVRTINAAWRAQITQLRKTVPAPVAV